LEEGPGQSRPAVRSVSGGGRDRNAPHQTPPERQGHGLADPADDDDEQETNSGLQRVSPENTQGSIRREKAQ